MPAGGKAYKDISARTLTDEEKRKAVRALARQGVAPTRENIAEQAAVGGEESEGRKAAQDLGVGGPTSEIARRKQREMDEARRKGPPADVLRRFRERNR
jgi:hypothetical protein